MRRCCVVLGDQDGWGRNRLSKAELILGLGCPKIFHETEDTLGKRNRQQSRVRARVEHLFRIIKCQFGYRQVRYRGLEKNRIQVMSLMAMANLYLQRHALAI